MHFLNGIKRGKHLKRREARSTLQTQHSIDTLAALQILHSSHSPLHAPPLTLHTSLSTLHTPSRLHTPHLTPHFTFSTPPPLSTTHFALHTGHASVLWIPLPYESWTIKNRARTFSLRASRNWVVKVCFSSWHHIWIKGSVKLGPGTNMQLHSTHHLDTS